MSARLAKIFFVLKWELILRLHCEGAAGRQEEKDNPVGLRIYLASTRPRVLAVTCSSSLVLHHNRLAQCPRSRRAPLIHPPRESPTGPTLESGISLTSSTSSRPSSLSHTLSILIAISCKDGKHSARRAVHCSRYQALYLLTQLSQAAPLLPRESACPSRPALVGLCVTETSRA